MTPKHENWTIFQMLRLSTWFYYKDKKTENYRITNKDFIYKSIQNMSDKISEPWFTFQGKKDEPVLYLFNYSLT